MATGEHLAGMPGVPDDTPQIDQHDPRAVVEAIGAEYLRITGRGFRPVLRDVLTLDHPSSLQKAFHLETLVQAQYDQILAGNQPTPGDLEAIARFLGLRPSASAANVLAALHDRTQRMTLLLSAAQHGRSLQGELDALDAMLDSVPEEYVHDGEPKWKQYARQQQTDSDNQ